MFLKIAGARSADANKFKGAGKMKKLSGRIFRGIMLAAVMAAALGSTSAYADTASNVIIAYDRTNSGPGQGWRNDSDGSWIYQQNGDIVKDSWKEIDGKWYRFDANGKMLTGWQTIDGGQYYLTETADAAHPLGSCYMSETTPDGNEVDADGKLKPKPEPVQEQAAAAAETRTNPYGRDCIEIDLTNQMVYAYKGQSCVLASQCVTGRVVNGHATPAGNYRIYNKERNRTLKGTNEDGSKYASFVSYWMPFNGGIGLHDATWRTNFNADVYYNYGSHGCINMPFDNAAALYDIAYVGMPVYVHN